MLYAENVKRAGLCVGARPLAFYWNHVSNSAVIEAASPRQTGRTRQVEPHHHAKDEESATGNGYFVSLERMRLRNSSAQGSVLVPDFVYPDRDHADSLWCRFESYGMQEQ